MTELPLTRILDPGPKNQITSSKDTARYTRVKYEVLHVLPNTLGFVLELVHAALCTVLALLVTGAVIFEFILDDKQFIRKKSCCYPTLYSVLSMHSPRAPWRQGTIYTPLGDEQ